MGHFFFVMFNDDRTFCKEVTQQNDFIAELLGEESGRSETPPNKKRKFSPPPLLCGQMIFCPLQQEAWPSLIYRNGNEIIDISKHLQFQVSCTSEFSLHEQTGINIHYKRNQFPMRFSLTCENLPVATTDKNFFSNVYIQGSNLTLDQLFVEIQIIESDSLEVNKALENSIDSPKLYTRQNGANVPFTAHHMPPKFGHEDVRLYFERSTSNNGSKKKQCYFYIMVSLCAVQQNTRCALRTEISFQPLIVRGGNPAAYKNKNSPSASPQSCPSSDASPQASYGTSWNTRFDPHRGDILYTNNQRVGIN